MSSHIPNDPEKYVLPTILFINTNHQAFEDVRQRGFLICAGQCDFSIKVGIFYKKKINMAVVVVNYTERQKYLCYEGLVLHFENIEKKFAYGSIIQDWLMMLHWLTEEKKRHPEKDFSLYTSSTLDHFFFDGGGECCDSAFLHFNNDGKPVLKYSLDAGYFTNGGIEIFVPKNTKYDWRGLLSRFNVLRQKNFYKKANKQ